LPENKRIRRKRYCADIEFLIFFIKQRLLNSIY
jgi:hypothetical protein